MRVAGKPQPVTRTAPGGSGTGISTWAKAHGKAVTAVTVASGTLYEVHA